MTLNYLLNEFDHDLEFINDLLFTIANESNHYIELLKRSEVGTLKTNEARRVAHLLKSTTSALGLFTLSDRAANLETVFAESRFDEMTANRYTRSLLEIAEEVRRTANNTLREIMHE